MKRKWLLKILGVVFFWLQLHGPCSALEIETHKKINEYIATKEINNFSLDSYVMNQLGLKTGVETYLKRGEIPNRIREWLRDGGQFEDEPGYTRSFNHFHDPLKPLDLAGFTYPIVFPVPFTSALKWAQNQYGWPGVLGGDQSWKKARDSFYKGLTALNKDDRDGNLADTFRALGQIMHLVQDVSVPAHARNDPHVYFDQLPLGIKVGKYHYEVWVKQHPKELQSYLEKPPIFDKSVLNCSGPPSASLPIANIFDTFRYGSLRDLNVAAQSNVGLAEYTNANFFSNGTIFKNYPHPTFDDTDFFALDWKNAEIVAGEDGRPDKRLYIRKIAGEPVQHLASVSYLSYNWIKRGLSLISSARLDDEVHKDYASKLLPRAVGYSAGLLEYFFRGKLHVALLAPSVGQAIYNFGNEHDMGRNIGTVAMFIQNNSKLNNVIEPIGQGTISLTVSYVDSRTGETVYQHAGTGSITDIPEAGTENFLSVLFTLPQPIPTQFAKGLTYTLVFRGQLGKEEDAVIGKVIKAPVVHSVAPDQGIEGTLVVITGDDLPEIESPFPTTSRNVNFSHDESRPYTAEVINRTDTEITAKVPNIAAIRKPGYGGLRVRRIIPDTEEMIYSNPVPFFPIAEGEIRNSGGTLISATIEAVKPILGDYDQLPQPIIYPVPAGDPVSIQLKTGFTYKATANTSVTQDIWTITPDAVDFIFDLQ
jgi:hypothetical protein